MNRVFTAFSIWFSLSKTTFRWFPSPSGSIADCSNASPPCSTCWKTAWPRNRRAQRAKRCICFDAKTAWSKTAIVIHILIVLNCFALNCIELNCIAFIALYSLLCIALNCFVMHSLLWIALHSLLWIAFIALLLLVFCFFDSRSLWWRIALAAPSSSPWSRTSSCSTTAATWRSRSAVDAFSSRLASLHRWHLERAAASYSTSTLLRTLSSCRLTRRSAWWLRTTFRERGCWRDSKRQGWREGIAGISDWIEMRTTLLALCCLLRNLLLL